MNAHACSASGNLSSALVSLLICHFRKKTMKLKDKNKNRKNIYICIMHIYNLYLYTMSKIRTSLQIIFFSSGQLRLERDLSFLYVPYIMELIPELCGHELLFNSVGGHDQQLVVYKKEKKKILKYLIC